MFFVTLISFRFLKIFTEIGFSEMNCDPSYRVRDIRSEYFVSYRSLYILGFTFTLFWPKVSPWKTLLLSFLAEWKRSSVKYQVYSGGIDGH